MADVGDSFISVLKQAHREWGTYRHTDTRSAIEGEAYIAIPAKDAYRLNLMNEKGAGQRDLWGITLFHCESADGLFSGVLRAQGSQSRPQFAKQFSADNNLRGIGSWYKQIGAKDGDRIKVTWLSKTDIQIEKL